MRIFIPTFKRRNKQKTLGFFQGNATLVGNTIEDIPDGHIDFLLHDEHGLRAKRQFILEYAKQHNITRYAVIDDDLTFQEHFYHDRPGKTNSYMDSNEYPRIIEELHYLLDKGNAIAGITQRLFLNHIKYPVAEFSNLTCVMAYNAELIPEDVHFRIEVAADHDFHMQIISKGLRTAKSTRFCASTVSNTPGGCSTYRTPKLVEECFKITEGYWGKYVRRNKKPLSYTYYFKKLYEDTMKELCREYDL